MFNGTDTHYRTETGAALCGWEPLAPKITLRLTANMDDVSCPACIELLEAN